LDTSPAEPEVVLGDARISLERELAEKGSQQFDVIHLDAFSGDAVPAHLLTAEAFELYEHHLRKDAAGTPTGIIVVHISNRYLDLQPVVAALVRKFGYEAVVIHKQQGWSTSDTASDWVLVTRNREFLDQPQIKTVGEPLAPATELLWTDQFTPLFPILY
jgi:spermidine synthase